MSENINDLNDIEQQPPAEQHPVEAKASFAYQSVSVAKIELDAVFPNDLTPHDKSMLYQGGGTMVVHGGKQVRKVIIGGQSFYPTGRFWSSLYARFNLNNAFFKYFTHEEVFKRVAEKERDSNVRIAIETNKHGEPRLLAATGLNKPVVVYDDLLEILDQFKTDKGGIRYHDGIVTSTHTPRIGNSPFSIAGDKFSNKFELHCPVDGYGQPDVYLSLLRWVCSNGAVGFAKAFKTSLVLGGGSDDTDFAIRRALDSFANDEGYASLRERFDLATRSWASIGEQQDLYHLLLRLQNDAVLNETVKNWSRTSAEEAKVSTTNALLKAYGRVTSDPYQMYGSDPNLMSSKRRRTLPVACRVYDLLNFATELATHHVSEANSRQLQAWVGNMLSNDFDLEESCDQFDDWREMFLSNMKNDKT